MSGRSSTAIAAAIVFAALPVAAQHEQHAQHEQGRAEGLVGTVHFQTTCKAEVADDFDRAVALLHSFWFPEASEAFKGVLAKDPACGMAEWGVAMASWGNPLARGGMNPKTLGAGQAAATAAQKIGAASERERAYINAVAELYRDFEKADGMTRAKNYELAMERLMKTYPDDTEAAIFCAMALNGTQSLEDKTYANMLKAAAILEPLLEKQPNHPGIAHYLIHAYDAPPLANRGLKAARSYAKIAPAVPHALHMPSHTFTRLGYWQESIDTNRLSAEAARKANAPGEELHAYDYQAYAYLQTGQDQAAKQVLDTAEQVRARIQSDLVYAGAGGYALAAMPARYTLERGDWAGAAALTVHPSGVAYVDAMTHFARALGAARSGRDTSAAAPDIAALAKIAADLVAKGDHYWSTAVTVQRLGASAWLANAKGNADEAVRLMREAADLEDTIEKSAVSPGPIAPARELLGELLLALKKPAAALVEFEKSAQKEPNRFRGVYGAAQAAAQAGQQEKARTLYTQLLQICQKGDTPGRAELADARRAAGGPSQ